MLSMYCTASMLPCGRYYYAPEGGYVGNPWVKFSYQYCYLYLGWIVHHLDVIEHYCFRYSRHIKNHSRDLNKKFYRKLNIKRTNKTRKQRGGTEDEDLLNILNLMISYYVPNFLSGTSLSLLEINHNINSLFDQIDI
jgi:hypothetical protein